MNEGEAIEIPAVLPEDAFYDCCSDFRQNVGCVLSMSRHDDAFPSLPRPNPLSQQETATIGAISTNDASAADKDGF